MSLEIGSVKHLRPDVAVAPCHWQMATRTGILTPVVERDGRRWTIVALHNTDRSLS